MERSSPSCNFLRRPRLVHAVALGCFVVVFTSLTISSVSYHSPAYDETFHLFAGYSYLKWGDYRANPEHPPLAKILAALPLLSLEIKDPRPASQDWDLIPRDHNRAWIVANQMVFVENDAETLFFYGKLPMIGLGILLGIFVYIWARAIWGVGAAAASLFVYCLDPNILAHSSIIHTDIPFAAFFFIATYFFWRALRQLHWTNLFLTSIFFALSAITKHSSFLILPVWGLLGLLKIFSSQPQESLITSPRITSSRTDKAALLITLVGSALVTAYLGIWAAYGFRYHAAFEGEARALSMAPIMPRDAALQTLVSLNSQYHLFPEAWSYGVLYVAKGLRRPTYFLGEISENGFWLYFPVAFAVKTPVPTLLLLLGALGIWMFKRKPRFEELFLIASVVVYFSLAVWSGMNIGFRHLLPMYPFLFVLLGGVVQQVWSSGRRGARFGLAFLGLWYLGSLAMTYPHTLAYFNEIVGGPKNGYKVLTDSNLDWGQDLKGLKRWMEENGVKRIQLGYFGTADPKYYGIDALYLPGSIDFFHGATALPAREPPKFLAVSATYVYGIHSGISLEEGKRIREFYRPLRDRRPIATIGHSIFVYKVGT